MLPDVPLMRSDWPKQALGFGSGPLLLTGGLLSSGKGVEHAIEAVAGLIEEFPALLSFSSAGQTCISTSGPRR